jgi:3-oxoacyl-[acyl-carrier protein] reductase
MKLNKKIAIVTGAGQGIGRATCLRLARDGAHLVINDINLDLLEKLVKETKTLGHEAIPIVADISIKSDIDNLVQKTLEAFGTIDILVNNAGIYYYPVATSKMSEEYWDAHIKVNLKGTFLCCQAVGRQMIKQNGGRIINIATVGAHECPPGQLAYGASKAGILLMTKTLAVEWAMYNIAINAISPGIVKTPTILDYEKQLSGAFSDALKKIPIKRFIEPEEIAEVVSFLVLYPSIALTGAEIIVDGGLSAMSI